MMRPWYFGPLLAAVALAVSAYWWQVRKDMWSPPHALKPDLPHLEPLPQPARINAKQALERPLFWTSRRPVEQASKGGMARELSNARLAAVLESGASRVALLLRPDGSLLKITAETKPWQLESFDGRQAVFVSPDKQRVARPLEAGASVNVRVGPGVTPARQRAAP